MNSNLLAAAAKEIPNTHILVNMVSRRVRQLTLGHRPMVQVPPGTREADTALSEIIEKKITFESTFGLQSGKAPVVPFPTVVSSKKAA